MGPSVGGVSGAARHTVVLAGAVVLTALTGPVPAQGAVLHGTGAMTVADVDRDGRDDVLVDVHGNLHTWFGVAGPPWLRRGPTTWVGPGADGTRLIVSGDLAYRVVTSPQPGVRIHRFNSAGQLQVIAHHQLDAARQDHEVARLRLCPLGFDFDGNGRVDDVAIALLERAAHGGSGISIVYAGAGRAGAPRAIPTPADGETEVEVVALFRSRGVVQPGDEILCVVSAHEASSDDALGSFSVGRTVSGAPRVTGLRWFGAVPRLRMPAVDGTTAAVAYGAFRPTPQVPVPTFHFDLGPSVVLHPQIAAPWIDGGGAWLETSASARILDGAVADYDGDGADELMVVEPAPHGARDWLIVTDPHPWAADWQVLDWSRRQGGPQVATTSRIAHAVAADLDGDGHPEMVLSCEHETGVGGGIGSELAVLAAASIGSGRRELRRVR